MDYDDTEASSGTSKRLGKKHIGLSMGIVKRDLTLKGRNVLSRRVQEKPLDLNNPNRFEGEGVIYRGKLIGVLEVNGPRGDPICQEALSELKIAVRAAGEHKQRILICIGMDGIRLRDERTSDCLYHHPVHKISFIAQDMTDTRAFGYIFGSPDQGHRFFGIKTERAASAIVMAMRDLFQVVFDLKKKEIEQAKRLAEETRLTNGTATRRADSVSSTSGLVRDKSNHSVVTADLLDLESELCSLQEGLHQMGSLTTFKSVDDPLIGASTEVLYDPFGDSFSGSFTTAKENSGTKLPDVTLPSSSASASGKKSPLSVSPLPPPVYKSSRTLPRKETVEEPKKPEVAPQGFAAKFEVNFPDPFSSDGRFEERFSFSRADRYAPLNDDSEEVKEARQKENGPSGMKGVAGESSRKVEEEAQRQEKASEPQVVASNGPDPLGDIFSELDPLGTGKVRPYIDKKDFFQDLKQQPKKPPLKELPGGEEPPHTEPPPRPVVTNKLSNDSGSFFDMPDWKPKEFEQTDPFGSLNFVPTERDPFDTQMPLFGAPPPTGDAFGGSTAFSASPTFQQRSSSKSPQLRRISSSEVKSPIPGRSQVSRQITMDLPVASRKSEWSGSESSLPGTPPSLPLPKVKNTTPQKPSAGLTRILSQESVSGSDSESRPEINAPQPPPRPAAVQPPPLPPKRVAGPTPSVQGSSSIRADSDDDWASEDTPPLPAPSRKPRTRDVFTPTSQVREMKEEMSHAAGHARSLNSVTLAQLSTMSISDLAATLRLPPAKLAAMTLTELALRLSELTAEEEEKQRRDREEAIESFIASSKHEETRKFSATDRYQILGDSFDDDTKVEQHEPTVVSFRGECPPSTQETPSSPPREEFPQTRTEFSPDFESHFSKEQEKEQQTAQDRYAALREIFAAEGLITEQEPTAQGDSSETSLQEDFKLKPGSDSTTNLFEDSFEPKWDSFPKQESKSEEKVEAFQDFADRFPPASAFEDDEVSFLNRFSSNRQSDASAKSKASATGRLSVKTVSASGSPSPFEDDFVLDRRNSSDVPRPQGRSRSSSTAASEFFNRSVSVASEKISGFESNFTKFDDGFGDNFVVPPTLDDPPKQDKEENDFSKGFSDGFADFDKAYNKEAQGSVKEAEGSGSVTKSASVNIFEEAADPFDDDFFQKPSVSRISEDFPDDFIVENI